MEMDQFMEIVENSGKFEIIKAPTGSDAIYEAVDKLSGISINGFIIYPSKIKIVKQSIHFWVNPSYLGWDLGSDIRLGSFLDVKDLKSLKIN